VGVCFFFKAERVFLSVDLRRDYLWECFGKNKDVLSLANKKNPTVLCHFFLKNPFCGAAALNLLYS